MAELFHDFIVSYGEEFAFSQFCDLNGNPVERTPYTHPYAYDEYVLFRSDDYDKEKDEWVYSDRLLQWNREAFGEAGKRVWPNRSGSQMFFGRKPEDINRFLNLYYGKEVKLTVVMQGCNHSSGYPYWIFAFRDF